MKKKLAIFITMFVCAIACFMGHSVKTQAASTTYKQVGTVFNETTKVGKYYFTSVYTDGEGYVGLTVKKSPKGKVYYKFNSYSDEYRSFMKFWGRS